MTTSGTSTFNPAITFIITSLYRKCGAIAEDETPTAGMFNDALFSMNAMVKGWMATGIHVWTVEEMILFFQQGQYQYSIGQGSTDNFCDANSYSISQLNLSAPAGASVITVVSAAGMAANQFFGVVLDSGQVFWTTIAGAPVGNLVLLASPLPSSASAQNSVFAYTTKLVRPLKIPEARLLTYNGFLKTPMTVLARKRYMDLPQPQTPGTPTQFFYSPQLVAGQLYAWPAPLNGTYGFLGTYHRPIQDFNTVSNTADFPQEWLGALLWNGALEMAPEYDVPPARYQMIQQRAGYWLDLAQNYDRESEPIEFTMDMVGRG